jgi:hypothetical protein
MAWVEKFEFFYEFINVFPSLQITWVKILALKAYL